MRKALKSFENVQKKIAKVARCLFIRYPYKDVRIYAWDRNVRAGTSSVETYKSKKKIKISNNLIPQQLLDEFNTKSEFLLKYHLDCCCESTIDTPWLVINYHWHHVRVLLPLLHFSTFSLFHFPKFFSGRALRCFRMTLLAARRVCGRGLNPLAELQPRQGRPSRVN